MINPYDTETERFQERLSFDSMPDRPQWQKVLNYMRNHECITSMIAFHQLGITSLHRRLTDIERNTSYVIDRKRVDVPNRPHHYEYRLK